MKKIIYIVLIIAAAAVWSCKEQHTLYSDAEYVMFADTASINMVQEGTQTFTVPVASTVACDYDRNFGVEIIDRKSNAIEGLHYRLESNTITIKAGERAGNVTVKANFENLSDTDTLTFALKLVMPEAVKWDLYGDETKVKMVKSCKLVPEDFTGWCMVTSMFIYYYPGLNTSMQRLIYTEKHPTEENTIIMHNFLYDGYDITMKLEGDNPAEPWITMDNGQVLSNERNVFGTIHGDDHILVGANPILRSSFNACGRYANLFIYVWVENLGQMVGYVTNVTSASECLNILEWVSDEEADRLERENGVQKRWK